MQDLFNDIFITKNSYKFGNEDETNSSVLGKNKCLETLSDFGKVLVDFLNFIHTLNSIEEKP